MQRRRELTGPIKPRTIAGRTILFDYQGYIQDAKDWDDEVAKELARESGLEVLGENHWRVIRFLREFYAFNGRTPLNQQIREGTGLSLLELQSLFPGDFKERARRIAGLPNPKRCGGV
jgi:dissimilatory sulfite reductase related protein